MTQGYHYKESGLDNVWLHGGVERHDTSYGPGISIRDVDGLHAAIGLSLADRQEQLSGMEVRFLRHELDLSQRALGDLLGVTAITVARWEKEAPSIQPPAQRLLSGIYREAITGDANIGEHLRKLSEPVAVLHEMIHLELTEEEEWEVCA